MDHENEPVGQPDECKDLNDNGERKASTETEDTISVKIEEQNSSSSSDVQDDKSMEDSCIKEVPSSNVRIDFWEQPSELNQDDGDHSNDCNDAEEKNFPTAPPSISNLHLRIDSLLSDANIKASDAAINLKEKIRSLSPAKRKTEPDGKEKGSSKKTKRISQLMSGASFKTKCALFKRVFKDLAAEESLIIDYSCALQRDILVHGRIYLSQNWLCFYSNIFGWETLATINWHEIKAITKEKTARVIPNAVRIATSEERYFFTSFVSRDTSYTALFRVWQNALLGQPSDAKELRQLCRRFRKRTSSDNADGVQDDRDVDETGDEATENDNETRSMSQSETSQDLLTPESKETSISVVPPTPPVAVSDERIWFAEPDNSDLEKNGVANVQESKIENNDDDSDESSRSPSPLLRRAENLLAFARRKRKFKKKTSNKVHSLLPSPDTNVPKEAVHDKLEGSSSDAENEEDDSSDQDVICPCIGTHPGVEYCVEEFDFDVDALFEHLFSSDSDVMKEIHESRKMLNVNYHDIIKNEDGSSERLLTYLLTLNYTIGPKHSETTVKQIFHKDNTLGSFYVIETDVFNKGIPYADSFHIFALYCLTKLAGNRCKMRIHSEVRYTKSMMGIAKNMIQRNSDQAFVDYFKHLVRVLRKKSQMKPAELPKKQKSKQQLSKEDSIRDKDVIGKVADDIPDETLKSEPAPAYQGNSYSPVFQLPEIRSTQAAYGFTVLLVVLLIINIYLFFRVYHLEKFAVMDRQSSCIPNKLPVTDDNWYKLLQTQKRAHDLEVKRLKDVIGGTATLIKQVETSIKELYNELDQSFTQDSSAG